MTKIPVHELSDFEGNLDGNKLVDALIKGAVTLYGMDMGAIQALKRDYLQRGGHLPITKESLAKVARPEASDTKRLDWMSLHKPVIEYWSRGQRYNGVERDLVEVEWGHTKDKPLGELVGADTLREAIDKAISFPSLPQSD